MAAEPQVYEILAQALLYPDATFVARMQARDQALSVASPWAQQMVDALSGEALEDLQAEHVRLFVNAYGGAPCLPYESVYVEGRVLGEVAQEVAAFYAQWGVREASEMPDHAAVELAFAAQLARLRSLFEEGEERNLVRQALEEFERDHLRVWLPGLAADLQTADLAFYRALGVALQAIFGVKAAAGRSGRNAASSDLFLDLPA
ncbi:MAG: molecular chaperone TorD family protein [Chloroflexi bacterium]|nr:molecular chaperone TorD family protein [Chloroflexota bacterium]